MPLQLRFVPLSTLARSRSVTSAARTAYRLRRRRRRSSGAAPHETAPERVVLSPDVRANLTPSQIVENRNENSACADGALANVADFANFANFAMLEFFSGT
jgi:phosphohistidine phosphatase SixA